MLKRKIEQRLVEWKNTPGHKPLIVKGCRQCGKTFSVLEFARKNYRHVVYLNFFENPDYASVFAGSLEIDNIIMLLSALLGKEATFEAGQTVLVLDEIQDCPEARTALKFFRIDGRYDVIGTGSLLGVKGYGKEPKSVPVGSETVIDMYPLDFEEFLWANGYDDSLKKELLNNMIEGRPIGAVTFDKLNKDMCITPDIPVLVELPSTYAFHMFPSSKYFVLKEYLMFESFFCFSMADLYVGTVSLVFVTSAILVLFKEPFLCHG